MVWSTAKNIIIIRKTVRDIGDEMSVAVACRKHSVPHTSLQGKLNGWYFKAVGLPTALFNVEEKIIVGM